MLTLIPFGLFLSILVLEFAVSFIQSYVFYIINLFLYQGCYLFTLIPYDLSFYLDLETYFLINSSLILIKTNKILLKKKW